ncbi:DUF4129 domain-containing protein [Aeropyrum camini]|uniref:DUF4129 domain-containing protein n=1 Tax=Aeropyrum camini TaxID=229980 RepID=UPI000786B052|nr:DUF4129 domain-containing protein [Aeropyrum camini]
MEGLEIFMLAYGLDEDKPYASTTIAVALSDAGGEPSFTLIGPASHVLLTLVNAVIIDDQTVVLFPVSSRVVLATPRGELPGSVNVGPGRPNIEDKIRDELLPDEVKQSYGRGIASPQAEVEPEDNERGGGGNSIIDISSLLRELASRLTNPEYPGAGGRGASIPHSGIADDSNTAAIVASPIGRLGITYEDFARIAEALRLNLPSASAGDGLEGGEVLVPVSPIERAGSSLGLVIAAVLVFGTIALAAAYAPDLRRAIVSRLVLSRGYSVEGAVESCFREALQVLKDMGLKREPWETPREFLARVEGSLEAEQVYAMRYITSLYERHRYGGWEPSTGELEECIRSVEALRSRGRGG